MSDRGGLRGVTRNSLKPDRSEADVEALERQVAGLPSEVELNRRPDSGMGSTCRSD